MPQLPYRHALVTQEIHKPWNSNDAINTVNVHDRYNQTNMEHKGCE